MNPNVATIKYLIESKHLIPVFKPMKELGESYHELLPDHIEVSTVIKSLLDDFSKVLKNGSVHQYSDPGYYNNYSAVDASIKIGKKWGILK